MFENRLSGVNYGRSCPSQCSERETMTTTSEFVRDVITTASVRRDEELAAIGLTWDEVIRLANLNTGCYTASDRKKWRKVETWYHNLKAQNAALLEGAGRNTERILA